MTIIPASILTPDDLRRLGNNLMPSDPVDDAHTLAAERSLAALDETVDWFDDLEDPIHLALAS